VILVEHQMDLVMDISDEVLVLNYGTKIAEGKPKEIQNNQEVITAYLGEKIEIVKD
jgi:branched-chain amino acid transport system ATP-binding protein